MKKIPGWQKALAVKDFGQHDRHDQVLPHLPCALPGIHYRERPESFQETGTVHFLLKICPGHPKNHSKPKPFTCWPFRPSGMTGFSRCGHVCMPEETKSRACLHPRVQDCHQKNMNPKGLYKDYSTSRLKEGYPGVRVSSGERLAWAESCRNRNSRGKVEIEKEPEKAKYSPRRSLFQQNLFHPSQTGLHFQLVISKKFLQSL